MPVMGMDAMDFASFLDHRLAELSEPLIQGGAGRMIRHYAAGMPAADRERGDPDLLFGAALGLFTFARERSPGIPHLRVFDPDLDRHGWVSGHTVI